MRWLPTAIVMLLVIVGGGLLTLWIADSWSAARTQGMDPTNPETAALRLDAVKTALTVAAGLGAGVTLLLALRRQSINERAQRFAEEDAQEERITTLYVAAVEQLGSDKAAVRLGGLYALERLGDNHPHLRQTVVDVVCAYLRMPFTLAEGSQDIERRQEQEVRLTAQHVLATHLSRPERGAEAAPTWPALDGRWLKVNLRGATLLNLELTNASLDELDLTEAQLYGTTSLLRLSVIGQATLRNAAFHGPADFFEARFHAMAWFGGTVFSDNATFRGARFEAYARFVAAKFDGHCDFLKADFRASVGFAGAVFGSSVVMSEMTVSGRFDLEHARFRAHARLRRSQFLDNVTLSDATFSESLDLRGCGFRGDVNVAGARAKQIEADDGWELSGEPDAEGLRGIVRVSGSPEASEPGAVEISR